MSVRATTNAPAAQVRREAVDWLLRVIDHEMIELVGEVATPLDHLSPRDERDAVHWVRAMAARIDEGGGSMHDELVELVRWMDDDLDGEVADRYRDQPLAQDWARVAKVAEEAGEAIDALIGVTGQNPRKGEYGSRTDLYDELADVALTGLYALQHFVKNGHETLGLLMDRARHHRVRREQQIRKEAS